MKTDSAQIQYDKMTKTPINKLVLQLGLPTTVSMLVTSVYNMADTFFVASWEPASAAQQESFSL